MAANITIDVTESARLLRQGRLVAFATETVYGLGANALDARAVAAVFEAKQRPHFDPLIVHLADADNLNSVAQHVPAQARQLIERFWPGPLTLVLPKASAIPDLVTAGLPTVAVRVPDHPQARALIREAGVPVAAPSANPFGRISPTTAAHVMEQLGERIDAILDGGACRIGLESTVLEIRDGFRPRLLRPGGLTVEQIEEVIGNVERGYTVVSDGPQTAPGMLTRHYAPQKPVMIVQHWDNVPTGAETGALSLQSVPAPERFGQIEILSSTGSLNEAAANFFAAFRRLDRQQQIKRIVAKSFPDQGLGLALNDRLRRAAQT